MKFRIGITAIITSIALSSLVAITAAILLLSFRAQEKLSVEHYTESLNYTSVNLAEDLLPLVTSGENQEIAMIELLLRLDVYSGVVAAGVFDREQRLLAAYRGPLFGEAGADSIQSLLAGDYQYGVNTQGYRLVAHHAIGEQEIPVGSLVVIEDIARRLQVARSELIAQMVLPLGVLFVLLAVSTSWALSRFSSPITALSKMILNVAQTKDYAVKVPIKGGPEVRLLATNFNHLLAQINKQLFLIKNRNRKVSEQRDKLKQLANEDMLTGLPNRQYIYAVLGDELQRVKSGGGDFFVLFFDLDGFKEVNDSLGHDVGDLLLSSVARRVEGLLDDKILFARLGGDEFLVVSSANIDCAEAMALGESMVEAFDVPLQVKQWSLTVGVSVGVACASDADYELNTLIRQADMAMFESKQLGKHRVTRFSKEMESASNRRQLVGSLLPTAIAKREFSLVYQPRIGPSGEPDSYEALVRWTSKELGWVSPGEFIPIAEQAGHISKLSVWVIQQACRDLRVLQSKAGKACRVSINLSSLDVQDEAFVEKALTIIEVSGVPYDHIEFEITETAYLENIDSAIAFCKRVKGLGCHVALDDFGTGYSSLSYLTRIDIDTLKIDRQFVSEVAASERDFVVIEAVVAMAKQLGLSLCAEGVETQEQVSLLRNLGCDELQGYYFAKPSPLSEIQDQTKVSDNVPSEQASR